uniref:Uncharacterized protein n=1 Tax=Myoviridae sp. ctGBP5 TaxID=2825071 RepID=A0A8S5PBS2_9CAUD|nr:MAG TPA: hypothetical protein [Myoviridae sp. ctGBP5]
MPEKKILAHIKQKGLWNSKKLFSLLSIVISHRNL